jgi:predicted esterase
MSTSTTLDSAHVLWLAPEPKRADRPLVVLMHGWSYDERHLFGFADLVPGEMVVASVRAPHAEVGGMPGSRARETRLVTRSRGSPMTHPAPTS